MLTTIQLDGVMGRKFGKSWELDINSPAEALRLIEANQPGLKSWIIQNIDTYKAYQVTCVYENGTEGVLSEEEYGMHRQVKSIRFTPIVSGSGGGGGGGVMQVVIGAVLIVAAFVAPLTPFAAASPYLYAMGATMILGGIVQMLSPRPSKANTQSSSDGSVNSNYFDGPVNTEMQGNPVPLIYGRMLTGSHPISASITIDEATA